MLWHLELLCSELFVILIFRAQTSLSVVQEVCLIVNNTSAPITGAQNTAILLKLGASPKYTGAPFDLRHHLPAPTCFHAESKWHLMSPFHIVFCMHSDTKQSVCSSDEFAEDLQCVCVHVGVDSFHFPVTVCNFAVGLGELATNLYCDIM